MPALLHWGNTAYPDYLPLITASYRSSPQYDRSLRLAAFFNLSPLVIRPETFSHLLANRFNAMGFLQSQKPEKATNCCPSSGSTHQRMI